MTVPMTHDRVRVNGRKGVFLVVSVDGDFAHVMALDGIARVIKVPLNEIELEVELKPRTYPA